MELDRAIEKEMIVKLVVCSFKYMYYDGGNRGNSISSWWNLVFRHWRLSTLILIWNSFYYNHAIVQSQ